MKKFQEFINEGKIPNNLINKFKEPNRSLIRKEIEYIDDVLTMISDHGFSYELVNVNRDQCGHTSFKNTFYYDFFFYCKNDPDYDFDRYDSGYQYSFKEWIGINTLLLIHFEKIHNILSKHFVIFNCHIIGSHIEMTISSDITDEKFKRIT